MAAEDAIMISRNTMSRTRIVTKKPMTLPPERAAVGQERRRPCSTPNRRHSPRRMRLR